MTINHIFSLTMILNHVIVWLNKRGGGICMVGIAELRARKGKMSQRELAEKLGTTQTSISNWEKDPLSMNASNIVKMAMFFGVSSDDILGIEKKEKTPV